MKYILMFMDFDLLFERTEGSEHRNVILYR